MPNIRYLLTTLDPQPLGSIPINYPVAEVPFTGVTFSKCWNQAGPFSATLNIEDPQVLNTNWIDGTNPGKCFFWVFIDGVVDPVFGGRILTRVYQESTQQVTITGADFYSYWAQRLQTIDFTQYIQAYTGATSQTYDWANTGAPAPMIAWWLLQLAYGTPNTLFNLVVPFHGEGGVGSNSDPDYWVTNYPSNNFVTFSAPAQQEQTIDSLLQQFSGMGAGPPSTPFDGIGVDIVTDTNVDSNGNPLAAVSVYWPRYGKSSAQMGNLTPVMDLSSALDFQWSEDATSQATGIIEQTSTGGIMAGGELIDSTAIDTYNYPLTEQAICHTSASPTALSQAVLETLAVGDRDLYAYPQLAPVVTVPAFSNTAFDLRALPLGDDCVVFNPFFEQEGQRPIPIPAPGSSFTLRTVRADVTIADPGGVSTMQLTLNPPPGAPSPPGQYD